MPVLYDERGNPYQSAIDQITGQTITDARSSSALLSALNAESVMDLNGQSTWHVDARTGAASLTLAFEGTIDGTNYHTLPAFNVATEAFVSSLIITTTQATAWRLNVAGFRRVRVRVSAFTSGTVTIAQRASAGIAMVYAAPIPTTLAVTATAAANTGFTLSLPAAGAGLFHYITQINIMRNATAALAGTATLGITTTNLPGAMAWSVGNAMAAGGTEKDVLMDLNSPIKSSVANTATTIVLPAAGLAVLYRANVHYYVGA